uniref:Prostate and testis expressed 13 n=1 Tax=Nannospalax galili TaxID=1026970 RepID=A0A8C6W9V3_NANGA
MFRLILLGVFVMFLMDKGIKFCNFCMHYDGTKCITGMRSCWKFDMLLKNRSCASENYYYNDRTTGIYLFRYTTLSCKRCGEGMSQVFHDLLKETFCCTDRSYCNDGSVNSDISPILLWAQRQRKELNE